VYRATKRAHSDTEGNTAFSLYRYMLAFNARVSGTSRSRIYKAEVTFARSSIARWIKLFLISNGASQTGFGQDRALIQPTVDILGLSKECKL
jgi:hypothetical protein